MDCLDILVENYWMESLLWCGFCWPTNSWQMSSSI